MRLEFALFALTGLLALHVAHATIAQGEDDLDFPSIAAGSFADLQISSTQSGFGPGYPVQCGPNGGICASCTYCAFSEQSGQVTVRMFNHGSSSVNPASQHWRCQIDNWDA